MSEMQNRTNCVKLYHGSVIPNLNCIKANAKSHSQEKLVAYFTSDRVYALVCCRKREENFVTMGLREDGKQHYFERFPKQLEVMYKNKAGYLYILPNTDGMIHTKGNTWEKDDDVLVEQYEYIPDVYEAILEEERLGNIVIHWYEEIDPKEQKMHANYIHDHLEDENNNKEYREFLIHNFSALWD